MYFLCASHKDRQNKSNYYSVSVFYFLECIVTHRKNSTIFLCVFVFSVGISCDLQKNWHISGRTKKMHRKIHHTLKNASFQ